MPKSTPSRPLVWMLMGSRLGDNNQLLALGEALGFACQPKRISYNQLRRISFLRTGLTIVSRKSRALIEPPWPDIVIGVGYGSVPIARYIRQQSGGLSKLVHIGNPREKLKRLRSADHNSAIFARTGAEPARAAFPDRQSGKEHRLDQRGRGVAEQLSLPAKARRCWRTGAPLAARRLRAQGCDRDASYQAAKWQYHCRDQRPNSPRSPGAFRVLSSPAITRRLSKIFRVSEPCCESATKST